MPINSRIFYLILIVLSSFFTVEAVRETQELPRPAHTFYLSTIDNRTNRPVYISFPDENKVHQSLLIQPGLTAIRLPLISFLEGQPDAVFGGALFAFPVPQGQIIQQVLALAVAKHRSLAQDGTPNNNIDVIIALSLADTFPIYVQTNVLSFWENRMVLNLADRDTYTVQLILEGERLEQSRFTVTRQVFPYLGN